MTRTGGCARESLPDAQTVPTGEYGWRPGSVHRGSPAGQVLPLGTATMTVYRQHGVPEARVWLVDT